MPAASVLQHPLYSLLIHIKSQYQDEKLILPGIALAVALRRRRPTAPVESHVQLRGTAPTSFRVARHGDAKRDKPRRTSRAYPLRSASKVAARHKARRPTTGFPKAGKTLGHAGHEPTTSVYANDLSMGCDQHEGKGYMNAFSGINFAFIYVDKAYGEHVVPSTRTNGSCCLR